jgi:cell division transport system permease protein
MKLNRFGYLVLEGLKNIFSHGFMSFASVTIIVACLIIMGSFSLVAVNIDAIITDLEQQNQVLAFVDESLTDGQARELEAEIRQVPNVKDAVFVSREEAMQEYVSQYDDPSLFEDIKPEVFRHRYIIYLDDITQMQDTKAQLEAIPGIARVNAYLEIAEGFITVRNIISAISVILIVLLLVVSIFIMANTIKLASFTRREEIAVMKIVGASNGFIRLPFLVEGLVLGLLGGGIAFFTEWGVYDFINAKVLSGIAGELFKVIPFQTLLLPVLVVYLAVGFFVGTFGGVVAIRNYLKV